MIRLYPEQTVTDLDHRRGAAPEQVGKHCQTYHHGGLLHCFFIELHSLSFLLRL